MLVVAPFVGIVPPAGDAKLGAPRNATGRDAVLDHGLRAPPRYTAEPDSLNDERTLLVLG